MLLTIGMATVRDYDGPWATMTSPQLDDAGRRTIGQIQMILSRSAR